jgi:hypothetical protein
MALECWRYADRPGACRGNERCPRASSGTRRCSQPARSSRTIAAPSRSPGIHFLEGPEIELVPNASYVGGISDAPSDDYRLTFQIEAVGRQPQASTSTKVTGWGWALFILVIILFILGVFAGLIVNYT